MARRHGNRMRVFATGDLEQTLLGSALTRWPPLRAILAACALTRTYVHTYTNDIPGGIGDVMPDSPEAYPLAPTFVEALDVPADASTLVQTYVLRSRSPSTLHSYYSHLRLAAALAERWNRCPLPMDPGTACAAAAVLADAGYAAATIRNFVSALRFAHKIANYPDPTRTREFRLVYDGIIKTLGLAPTNQKAAVIREDLHVLLDGAMAAHTVKSAQQCAAVSIAFWGALRSIELRALDMPDLDFPDERTIRIRIRRSKTDRYARGTSITLHAYEADPVICPVRNLKRWLNILSERSGPVFRRLKGQHMATAERISKHWLYGQIKSLARRAGFDSAEVGSHSLRAGWETQATFDGVDQIVQAMHMRHTDLRTLLTYFRPGKRHYSILTKVFGRERPS